MAEKFYVICTTPRSGSNLLCDLLKSSEVMGQPSEFLNLKGSVLPLAKKHNLINSNSTIDLNQYINYMIEKNSSSNQCFGLKLLFDQFESFINFGEVKEILKKSKFLWLLRRDIIAQATSMYIATETDSWKSFEENKKPREFVEYNESKISFFVNRFIQQNLKWVEFFTVNKIDYLQVDYENILLKPNRLCHDICNFCGIETDHEFSLKEVRFKKQGDSLNEKLADIFRQNSMMNINKYSRIEELQINEIKIVSKI